MPAQPAPFPSSTWEQDTSHSAHSSPATHGAATRERARINPAPLGEAPRAAVTPRDSSQDPRDAHVALTLDCTVPSPVLMMGFCGDRASMWLPLTVTYCCTEGCAAPAAGTAACCGSSPGSCLMITWARQQPVTRKANTSDDLGF